MGLEVMIAEKTILECCYYFMSFYIGFTLTASIVGENYNLSLFLDRVTALLFYFSEITQTLKKGQNPV